MSITLISADTVTLPVFGISLIKKGNKKKVTHLIFLLLYVSEVGNIDIPSSVKEKHLIAYRLAYKI